MIIASIILYVHSIRLRITAWTSLINITWVVQRNALFSKGLCNILRIRPRNNILIISYMGFPV